MAKAKKQEKADEGASASKASDAAKSRSTKSTPAKAEPKAETAAGSAMTKPVTRAAAKTGAKSDKAASAGGAPLVPAIDTNLAAAAAASMVANRATLSGGGAAGQEPANPNAPKQESSTFKQLKQGLNKPAAAGGIGNLLGAPPGQKKSNLPFGGQQQNFRNQTFGADVNRSGVPRRTSG